VSLTEQKGVLYLRIRGFADSLQIKELKRTLKGLLPRHYSQMVVNTEGLRFVSEKAAAGFGAYLENLGSRVRRLQVVIAAQKQARSYLNKKSKHYSRLPNFELLLNRR
jgi:hypothetical protein